jgi:hypothetical protein
MKQLYLQVVIDLSDNAFEASDVYAQIKAPWTALIEALQGIEVKFSTRAEEMQVRAKAKPRKKKQDTPRLVETPPTPEAA